MSVLSKLKLSASTPNEPITPLARKRLKLITKMDQQIAAAEAEARDEEFVERVRKWVRDEETGEKSLVTKQLPVRKWWWQNADGITMVSLRDGNRLVPLNKDKSSVEVGDPSQLVQVLQTLKSAVAAGELDGQLETLIAARKPPSSRKPKSA